jgi:hypothetical protein
MKVIAASLARQRMQQQRALHGQLAVEVIAGHIDMPGCRRRHSTSRFRC